MDVKRGHVSPPAFDFDESRATGGRGAVDVDAGEVVDEPAGRCTGHKLTSDSEFEELGHAKLRIGVLSTPRLTPFSYCVLALVGQGGAGPHDLTRMMRQQGGLYWSAAQSQWYAEPKRLEELGYLRSRKEPGRTRERTHYMLTAAGRKALREWIEIG